MNRALLIGLSLLAAGAAAPDSPPVDPGATHAPDLVDLASVAPALRLDLRYATPDNVFGRALYPVARALLARPAAEALARADRAFAEQGLGIVVLDAYRPWSVTRRLWELLPPDRHAFVANPATGSRHNRGCAVDVTLYRRATGEHLPMPSEFDDLSPRAAAEWPGGTEEQRRNRDILRRGMLAAGFTGISNEWWHYDYAGWRGWPILDVPLDAPRGP